MRLRLFSNPDTPPYKAHLSERLFRSPLTTDNTQKLKTYAIIDIAQKFCWSMPAFLNQQVGLFQGEDKEEYEDIEPQLIELDLKDDVSDWLLDIGYGNNVCCFLMSSLDKQSLANQLASFIKVLVPNKTNLDGSARWGFLRYYDPRVMPDYIQNISSDTRRDFFKNIDCFFCENPKDQAELLFFYPSDDYSQTNQGVIKLKEDES